MKTNNTVKLAPPIEKELRIVQQKIQDAFDALDRLDKEQVKLERKLDSTNAEIGDLERTADPVDDSAMLQLGGKKVQRDMCRQRLTAIDDDRAAATEKAVSLVPRAASTIEGALAATFEAEFDEAVESIERFCDNREQAIEHVQSFSYFQQQSRFSNWANSNSLTAARTALSYMERILKGENVFEFQREGNINHNVHLSAMRSRVARVPA